MELFNTIDHNHLSKLTEIVLPTQRKLAEEKGLDLYDPATLHKYQDVLLVEGHRELKGSIGKIEDRWSEGCLGDADISELSSLFTPVLEGICNCINLYAIIQLIATKKVLDMSWLEDSVYACSLLGMSTIGESQRDAGITFRHIRSVVPEFLGACLKEGSEISSLIHSFLERCRSATSLSDISDAASSISSTAYE